jgi:hypothetical protein
MDQDALLKLWRLDEMPACDEVMRLAKVFLESDGEGIVWHRRTWPDLIGNSFGEHG